jgi:hypothetical protein
MFIMADKSKPQIKAAHRIFSMKRSLQRQNTMIQGAGASSCVLLHKHAQEVSSKPKFLPHHMDAFNRRCFKCGGKPQHLSLGAISEVVHSSKTLKLRSVFHVKYASAMFLVVALLLLVLMINLRQENGNGREVGHCHINAFMVLFRFKRRAEHVMGLGMGSAHPLSN